jgi:SAM-dependent methyltransferase
MNAFDITPAMLDRFREKISKLSREPDSSRSARNDGKPGIDGVELAQCDVLHLDALPDSWSNYELIISASMMEYLPRDEFSGVLRALRARLSQDGTLVLFITRRNGLMRPLIGRWWQSNLYTADELRAAYTDAGFARTDFSRFPFPYSYLNLWGHIVEAPA